MPGFAFGYAVAGYVLVQGRERSLVPEPGFEPGPPYGERILSPQRLPFRHSGRRGFYLRPEFAIGNSEFGMPPNRPKASISTGLATQVDLY